jgi:8-oxo-dGTP pyrophosphatase MutT (NUDIX family)
MATGRSGSGDSRLRPWRLLSKEVALKTPWFRIIKQHMRTPSGVEADYYVHDAMDSVICVCLTSAGKVIIEKQYRPPVKKVSYDYPAGILELGDKDPTSGIRRELREELGFHASSLTKLGTLDINPSFSQARVHVFLAKGDIKEPATPEPTESIVDMLVSPPKEILDMIDDGRISCVFCTSATFMAFRKLGMLDIQD